jgi:RNA polymerase sigma-70 factor (ECF subfamily)
MEDFQALPVLDEPRVTTDEASLIAAAQTNTAAFEALYQRYVSRVYRYLFLRVKHEQDAADLTQQVFLNALHALPRYRAQGIPFEAWLFRIARHVATDRYRQAKGLLSWEFVPGESQCSPDLDPEVIVIHQEALLRLRTLLADLDLYKRELLALRFAAGLSTTEIAAVVGKSQASVKKQLTRILHTLKEHYHEG